MGMQTLAVLTLWIPCVLTVRMVEHKAAAADFPSGIRLLDASQPVQICGGRRQFPSAATTFL